MYPIALPGTVDDRHHDSELKQLVADPTLDRHILQEIVRRKLSGLAHAASAQPPGISKPTGRPSRTMSSGSVAERIRNRMRGAFFRKKAT